jgi:hypothetical protein
MKKIMTLVFSLVFLGNVHTVLAVVVYSNNFDTLDSLDDLIVHDAPSAGCSVSIESGQLKLVGAKFSFEDAYVSIHSDHFKSPYTSRLADLPGKIIWSFNLSNMDEPGGGVNNGFEVHFTTIESNPHPNPIGDSSGYALMGGGLMSNNMVLRRTNFYYPSEKNLINIQNGLPPLPMKGSFRVEFTPATGSWELYAHFGYRPFNNFGKVECI